MQVVILASGRGTRMGTLTDQVPKPMLLVAGKNLIERKLEVLPPTIHEIILIIGYQGQVIRDYFGADYQGTPIRYVEQPDLSGTGSATWLVREYITDRFLVLMGDDLYAREDIETCIAKDDWVVLVEPTQHMASGGSVVIDDTGHAVGIEEGDHTGKPGVMNTNMFVLDARVFEQPLVPKAQGSEEFGLPQTVLAASKSLDVPLHAVNASNWIQITAPEDLEKAKERILTDQKRPSKFSDRG